MHLTKSLTNAFLLILILSHLPTTTSLCRKPPPSTPLRIGKLPPANTTTATSPTNEPKVTCPSSDKTKHGDYLTITILSSRIHATCQIIERNRTSVVQLGSRFVPSGLNKGLLRMCVGERRRVTAVGELAYGDVGFHRVGGRRNDATTTMMEETGGGHKGGGGGGVIVPPNATIVWDVELVEVSTGGVVPRGFLKGFFESRRKAPVPRGSPMEEMTVLINELHLAREYVDQNPNEAILYEERIKRMEDTLKQRQDEINKHLEENQQREVTDVGIDDASISSTMAEEIGNEERNAV